MPVRSEDGVDLLVAWGEVLIKIRTVNALDYLPTNQLMSEVVNHQQKGDVFGLRQRGKFRVQRRNIRDFVKLSAGPCHEAVGYEDAQPGRRKKTELSVETGGW